MTGRNNFAAKAFSLVMNMDKLVGGDFEKGLAELDAVTAAGHGPPPAAPAEPAPPPSPRPPDARRRRPPEAAPATP